MDFYKEKKKSLEALKTETNKFLDKLDDDVSYLNNFDH